MYIHAHTHTYITCIWVQIPYPQQCAGQGCPDRLKNILKPQCPSILSIQSHYIEDFENFETAHFEVVVATVCLPHVENAERHPGAPLQRQLFAVEAVEHRNGSAARERDSKLSQSGVEGVSVLGVERTPEVAGKEGEADTDPRIEQREANDYEQEHPRALFLLEVGQRHLLKQFPLHAYGIPVDPAALLGVWILLRCGVVGREPRVHLSTETQQPRSAEAPVRYVAAY